jgi:ParB family chromosome partitioning protein
VSEPAARNIAGRKKQAMAAAAETLLSGKGWLPAVLRTPAA